MNTTSHTSSILCDPAILNACNICNGEKEKLDALVAKHTAFPSFDAIVNTNPSYWPTITTATNPELHTLADAYDSYQEARGDSRRAFRTKRKVQ